MYIPIPYDNYVRLRKWIIISCVKKNKIENGYGIKAKYATTENTQTYSILGIVHQVTANLKQAFHSQNIYLDEDYPWSSILSATAFVA